MCLSFNPEEIVAQLRRIVWILRRGRSEIAVTTIALGLFLAQGWLPTTESMPTALQAPARTLPYILYGAGMLLLAWVVHRIWRQALPPPRAETPQPLRPAAVKGPMAFGPEDADLFRRLGREREMAQLLSLILNEQIPLVAVMGESGVGKTSLLRAGLTHILQGRDVRYIYWEALPTQSSERLLHAIQEQWQSSPLPQGLEDVLRMGSHDMPYRVIILDQFEQLHPEDVAHQPIFDALRRIATTQMAPYRTTWIVAFRREYDPFWRDFELQNPDFHPPMLSIRLFSKEQAKDILATLADAADLTLDQALVSDLVEAVARDGRVAAVDIGIGMLVLSELAVRKASSHLRLDDYRFAGGSEGLLTGYLIDRLERFQGAEREVVLKALLALANLETNQRHVEGRSLAELVQEAAWPPQPLQACLDYLAAPHIRLLEKRPGGPSHPPSYRLSHERLVSSLRQLTGLILAEVDQARLALDMAFRAWNNNGQHHRYLLDSTTLRQVKKHLAHIPLGEERDAKAVFLQRSQRKRIRRRGVMAMLVLLMAGIIVTGRWGYIQLQHKDHLRVWNVPQDLYSYQHQLKELHVIAPVTHLRWLKADLAKLTIHAGLQELKKLPRNLTTLAVSSHIITSLADLEELPQLTTLIVSNTPRLTTLAGLGALPQLTTLIVSDAPQLTTLAGLEKLPQLTTLILDSTRITSLADLEKLPQLTTLVQNSDRTSLAEIPKLPQLMTLVLPSSSTTSLEGLERWPRLAALVLRDSSITNLSGLTKLPQLTILDLSDTLELSSLTSLPKLPQLTTLVLRGSNITSLAGLDKEKLPQLSTLDLSSTYKLTNLAGLEKLPQLTTLVLSHPRHLASLTAIVEELPQLTTLIWHDMGIRVLEEVGRLPQLTALDLSNIPFPGLLKLGQDWRRTIRTIDTTRLVGLRELAQLTTLIVDRISMTSLADLEGLPQLTTLIVHSAPKLTNLAGLENFPQLTTLVLGEIPQLTSLAGLKKLPRLTTLVLQGGVGITGLEGLEKLAHLTILRVHGSRITSLVGLGELPQVTTLDLSHNSQLTTLAGIEKLPQLTTLVLSNTRQLTSLAGLEKLPQLTTLNLRGSGIISLEGLEKLRQLTTLDLRYTRITSIEMLANSQGLRTLYLPRIDSLSGLPISVTNLALE